MTATIIFAGVIAAIVAGALYLRWLSQIEDGWDQRESTETPTPLERKKADARIAEILRAADVVEKERRRVRAGDVA